MLKSIALVGLVATHVQAGPKEELVESIPTYGNFSGLFDVYSGYVPSRYAKSEENADPVGDRFLHYVLVESDDSPADDPLVLWFNGGPGCSSMLGFAQEHGPFVNNDGTFDFVRNEYSWNNHANMLYLEMPAGVGYSYMTDPKDNKISDETTAEENLTALLAWFEKFPEFKDHDFYISGESYGGIYVPTLVDQVDTHNTAAKATDFKFNLKGFIVGNGVTNWRYDTATAQVWGGFPRQEASINLQHEMISNNCNYSYIAFPDPPVQPSDKCNELFNTFEGLIGGLNFYDEYRTCWTVNDTNSEMPAIGEIEIGGEIKTYRNYYSFEDYTPWLFKPHQGGHHHLKGGSCTWGSQLTKLFNDKDVRKALHIVDSSPAWEDCTGSIDYSDNIKGSQWVYEKYPGKYRVLKYSGDTDNAVPLFGTQGWINEVGWKVTDAWRPYYVNNQVAGYVEKRENEFTLVTVHGCGHMAPQWKRPESYHMFNSWLRSMDL
jgi:serine carboxypeptidase-like clade 1